MDTDPDTSWLSMAEAGQRLGLSKDALRKRIARGKLEARQGNDGTTRVLVTSAMLSATVQDESGQVAETGELGRTLVRLDIAEEQAEHWRLQAEAAEKRAADADKRAAVAEADKASLRTLVDRLDAELDRLRRPWLERLGDVLRRR